ncbi:MAG: hypothetical protein JW724_00380, partial [Candidatus Altiarchaeota archaeon]|nr:hypothetical protein [Candidatus Altiarchaeota archaeon]
NMMGQASNTYANMDKKRQNMTPEKTVGGGIMAGLGGVSAGSAIAGSEMGMSAITAMGMTGPGAIAGMGALALGAYFLS